MKLKHLAVYGGMILVSGGCAPDRIAAPSTRPAPSRICVCANVDVWTPAPMFIVDGEVVGGSPSGLEPADIADIQFVKGLAAIRVYGAAGTNGVVVVTTRRAPPRAAAAGDEVPRRMLVLVNGFLSSAAALRALPADRIADIQLLRGGTALVRYFGAAAAEGVVVVRTKDAVALR